jgi:DNA-binding transcriptional LysR family regulator
MPTLAQLQAFLSIADASSFTRAAEDLGISQSSLSHALATFETEIGGRVLDRGRHGAQLTDLGRRIEPYARDVIAALGRIDDEAQRSTGIAGRVRLGVIPSASLQLMPNLVGRFTRRYPRVEVSLFEEPSQDQTRLTEWLERKTIDLAIVELPFSAMETCELAADELCAVVSGASEFAANTHVSIADLASQPLVMSRYTSERIVRSAFKKRSKAFQPRFEVQDLNTLMNFVREGLGVAILPRMAIPESVGGVAFVAFKPPLRRRVGIAAPSIASLSPAARAFIEMALP